MYTRNLMKIKLTRFWLSSLGPYVYVLLKHVHYLALPSFWHTEYPMKVIQALPSFWHRVPDEGYPGFTLFLTQNTRWRLSRLYPLFDTQSTRWRLSRLYPLFDTQSTRWRLSKKSVMVTKFDIFYVFFFLLIRVGQQFSQYQQNVWNAQSIK
jgi:hypothetical protein